MAKQGPETRLVSRMVKAAKAKYGTDFEVVIQHGGQFSATGVSDMLCCLFGVFVAAEVKAPESYKVKGKPSVEKAETEGATLKQRLFIGRIIAAGGCGRVVASVENFLDLLVEAEERVVHDDE